MVKGHGFFQKVAPGREYKFQEKQKQMFINNFSMLNLLVLIRRLTDWTETFEYAWVPIRLD